MADFNKVIIVGRLTRDVELRYTPTGKAVADLPLATNRTIKSGETTKKETLFIDVTVWGRTAENCNQYLKKGSQVLVDGHLSMDQWETNDGQKRTKHKVVANQVQFLSKYESKETVPSNTEDDGDFPY